RGRLRRPRPALGRTGGSSRPGRRPATTAHGRGTAHLLPGPPRPVQNPQTVVLHRHLPTDPLRKDPEVRAPGTRRLRRTGARRPPDPRTDSELTPQDPAPRRPARQGRPPPQQCVVRGRTAPNHGSGSSAGVTPTLHPQPRLRSNHHGHPPHHDNLKQSRTPGPADAPRPPTGHPPRPYRRANQVTVTPLAKDLRSSTVNRVGSNSPSNTGIPAPATTG